MLVWDVRTYDKQTQKIKGETPRPIYIVQKGSCDRWHGGVAISWWELREFLNPEGFARWVNDRIRELLPDEKSLVKLIDSMWPLVLRDTTPEERKLCRERLEYGIWYGRPITQTRRRRRPKDVI
jgi:hypothetical protein